MLRFTRSGFEYQLELTQAHSPRFTCHATVLPVNDSTVRCHSSASFFSPDPPPTSFLDTLLSWGHATLWDNLSFTGDGSWIQNGLVAGSLVIVHEGSYMPKVNNTVCLTALVIYCRNTGDILECTWAERSLAADNYRGEILGGVCAGLILRAATMPPAAYPAQPQVTHCDNMGVVRHTEWLSRPLAEKQPQTDVL